jgi:hypothetical protein
MADNANAGDAGTSTSQGTPRGAGGTPGGVGEFFLGVALAAAGGYLLTNQVTVTSGFWRLWGHSAFGMALAPLFLGIAVLFFNGRSVLGWVLTVAGAAVILAGVLTNLDIYFHPTSLFNTLVMLALLAGGLGLIARSLRAH